MRVIGIVSFLLVEVRQHFQVIKMLQLGIRPLCVTSTTCDLSSIGRKNIENIKSLGVDYMNFS